MSGVCYVMMACSAPLEFDVRIQQLAPSDVLNRQLSVTLLAGSLLQEGVSTNGTRSM